MKNSKRELNEYGPEGPRPLGYQDIPGEPSQKDVVKYLSDRYGEIPSYKGSSWDRITLHNAKEEMMKVGWKPASSGPSSDDARMWDHYVTKYGLEGAVKKNAALAREIAKTLPPRTPEYDQLWDLLGESRNRLNENRFDPHRIASEWHSGQGSALYAYCSTDRIPTEEFKERLVSEIEHSMAQANDEGLDELEYLLMHVEEQHPDQYPDSSMREAWATIDKHGSEQWSDDDDADIRDLYVNPEAFNDSPMGDICKVCGSVGCDCITAKSKSKKEEDSFCEICGGNEGVCECTMTEEEDSGWFSKVKKLAMTDVGGPQGMLTPTDRIAANSKTKGGPSKDFQSWQAKRQANESDNGDECPECGGPPGKHDGGCPLKNESKSSLRLAVARIMKEMKLSVAGGGHFDFSKDSADDDEDVTNFLLSKKDKDDEKKAPPAEKSGTKLKTTKKRSKSSQFR